jgi:hypothetical protein
MHSVTLHSHLPDLTTRVRGLRDELISRLGLKGSRPESSTVRIAPTRQKSIHETAIVEIAGGENLFRCFVKGNIPNYQGGQDLEAEYQTLANIGSKISDFNQHTRSPRALAFFPGEELLFLELVEGRTLKSILFDLQPSKHDLGGLLLRLAKEIPLIGWKSNSRSKGCGRHSVIARFPDSTIPR